MKEQTWIIDKYYNFKIDKNITLGNYLDDQIKKINNKISTTKNNYGDYMQLLSFLLDGKISKNHSIQLLIKAGGNINGINDAMRIINQ